jgi:hypothetical protein
VHSKVVVKVAAFSGSAGILPANAGSTKNSCPGTGMSALQKIVDSSANLD